MKLLVQGWTRIPHSYSLVNVFQLVHLEKYFTKVYYQDKDYYRPEWVNSESRRVFPEEYTDGLELWDGQDIDVVYSISFPYDVSVFTHKGVSIPKCVFYTCEFETLSDGYFTGGALTDRPDLFYTCPSEWSSKGMKRYMDEKNAPFTSRVISHGVESKFFRPLQDPEIQAVRNFYGVQKDDILLGNVGAMTRNKGILTVLQALDILVTRHHQPNYKLLLKGMGDLYESHNLLKRYIEEANLSKNIIDRIIFIDDTLTFTALNKVYNAIDIYMSCYLAEGFNLSPLEVLATGGTVILPRVGSTREYSIDIYESCGKESSGIVFVDCKSVNGCNHYCPQGVASTIIKTVETLGHRDNQITIDYIGEKYSWDGVANEIHDYLKKMILDEDLLKVQ